MKRAILAAFSIALVACPLAATSAGAYSQTGIASYYSMGKRTANGERYHPDGISAAHRSLPFGTRVRVTHLNSGRSIVVRINDRGPFIRGRIIDLSRGAAGALGIRGSGLARVRIEVIGSGKVTRLASTGAKKAKAKKAKITYVASAENSSVKRKKAAKKTSPQAVAFVDPADTPSLNLMSYQSIAKKK
jgi:rare lipoprotein A